MLVSVFFVPGASADSLTDALVKAYQSNPQLLSERANLRATDEEVSKAIALWRPRVTLSADYSKIQTEAKTDPATGFETKTEPWNADIVASQTVFAGGRILAQRRQADARVRAGRASLHAAEQGVFLDTVSSYMNVVRDESVLKLNEANIGLLKKQLEAAQARFEVGEITRTDVAQAEARLSAGVSSQTAAEASLKASRSAYERAVGEAAGTLETKPTIPPVPASEAEARELANALNPRIVGAREAEAASRYAIDLAVGAMLPTVSVQASYGRSGQERGRESIGDDTRVTATASMPIYQGGAEWASIRQAKEFNNKARLDAEDARRATDESVSNAWESYRAAKASSEANRNQVKAAEIAFEGVQQELEVGSRTTLDVLNQQQELLNARVALVRSERDEVVAGYALLSASGKLTAKELQLPVQLYDPVDNYDMQTWRPLGAATFGN
ncbi:MAG: TolC family outer membrane protein [Alphaproteobacteria bacterium]|nr:TolC family outer membrane protein [Alphaproteobacteria bacterium]